MKTCFKCLAQKPLSEFYKHKAMADGHLGKCKDCTKTDAKEVRLNKIEHYREYDRERGNRLPPNHAREYRDKYPNKYAAHSAVSNATRDGKLVKLPCEICGSVKHIHAHHDDYSKALDVRWLCAAHHRQWHVANGEAKNPI